MAKLTLIVFLAACVALSTAASFGGVKDWAGNYWDFTTGQYSSALTGKVYNTAPIAPVAPVAYVPPVAPVVAAPAASPYYYGAYPYGAAYGAPYGAPYGAAYIAPAWK